MTNALVGKHVIITGASRGLGTCIARAMWHQGASLLLVARSAEALRHVRDDLMATAAGGQQAHTVVVDLRASEAVPSIMSAARRVWDRLDVLVNNAGIVTPIGKLWENDWDEWQATI